MRTGSFSRSPQERGRLELQQLARLSGPVVNWTQECTKSHQDRQAALGEERCLVLGGLRRGDEDVILVSVQRVLVGKKASSPNTSMQSEVTTGSALDDKLSAVLDLAASTEELTD